MKQLVPALFAVGAIMALTGAAVYITGWNYAPYIYHSPTNWDSTN